MRNCLDPDQARYFFVPDLGSNCLQGLAADNYLKSSVNTTLNYPIKDLTFYDILVSYSRKKLVYPGAMCIMLDSSNTKEF